MSNYSGPQQAFRALGDALQNARNAELRKDEADGVAERAKKEMEAAREHFNLIRDEVIEEFPEVLEGYTGRETVTVVDGVVQVVRHE